MENKKRTLKWVHLEIHWLGVNEDLWRNGVGYWGQFVSTSCALFIEFSIGMKNLKTSFIVFNHKKNMTTLATHHVKCRNAIKVQNRDISKDCLLSLICICLFVVCLFVCLFVFLNRSLASHPFRPQLWHLTGLLIITCSFSSMDSINEFINPILVAFDVYEDRNEPQE